ncbi:GtrA-like protein [Geodermatophilus saharensis]|uniref:GtrA-like protein n=1 Tax=Geodermatophilus saharensis TaxID=1137994 RepID=A0A238ZFH5_9ACTN|nr:GtrA family protein [Geodermatophilus saharensis]SNR81852.1 GtrA-like protein [Geodermatophilus saharensis]
MTCPSSLHRPEAVVELGSLVRSDRVVGQFSRFVFVGGVSSAVYALLYWLLNGLGDVPANVVGSVISSMLANEMHRRISFHAGQYVGFWTAQWEGGALAALGLIATSLALSWFNAVADDPAVLTEILVIGLVTATIGTLRFIALRWVFRPRPA